MTQRGFTLIEALIAMMVVAGVVAALLIVGRDADGTAKQSQFVAEVQHLADTIHAVYPSADTSGYGGFSAASVMQSVTRQMPVDGSAKFRLTNAFGGFYAFKVVNWDAEVSRGVQITATGIPARLCAEMLMATKDQFLSVAAGSETDYIRRAPSVNFSSVEIADACSKLADAPVTMYFTVL